MTCDQWDADLAVTFGPLEEDLEGRPTIDRYGITVREELAGEPLAVALAQEEPDATPEKPDDNPWALIDQEWEPEERLFSRTDDRGPEEIAMHVERV